MFTSTMFSLLFVVLFVVCLLFNVSTKYLKNKQKFNDMWQKLRQQDEEHVDAIS